MAERWFFALWPDDAVRDALAARVPGLLSVGARATHPSDLHLITLARKAAPAPVSEWPAPIRWSVRELVPAAGYGGPGPRYRVRRRWLSS